MIFLYVSFGASNGLPIILISFNNNHEMPSIMAAEKYNAKARILDGEKLLKYAYTLVGLVFSNGTLIKEILKLQYNSGFQSGYRWAKQEVSDSLMFNEGNNSQQKQSP